MIHFFKFLITLIFVILISSCRTSEIYLNANYDYKAQPDKAVIMIIAAHPDDEAIFFGGAIPYYAQTLNVPVTLISMTTDWLKADGTRKNGSFVRESEMREAAWRYGMKNEPVFAFFQQNIRYWSIDKTWDRWADNILNGSENLAGIIRSSTYIAEQIRLYKPEVIITHAFNGEYGNPDHKALAYATLIAYELAAGKESILNSSNNIRQTISPDSINGDIWQTKKLYVHSYEEDRKVLNYLFHDFWEEKSIGDKSPREVANFGLSAHKSQGKHFVSSIYDNRGRKEFDNHPSELWSLIRSEVGQDKQSEDFTISGFDDEIVFTNWSRGNFLQNLPGP